MKTIRAKQAKVHLAYFVRRDQHGIIAKHLTNCNENVTLKLNFALSVLRLFHVGHFVQNRRSALSLSWHEWLSCKGKEWKIYCCELALLSESRLWKFHVVVRQTTSKNCTKKRAARAASESSRAARLVFLIQPIKSLIWNVVVAVTVASLNLLDNPGGGTFL